jgi:PTH2 family peptidyl-tRNA hydrolase
MGKSDVKQVIVIRKDLKMRRGKEIAQGSHASMAFIKSRAESSGPMDKLCREWYDTGNAKVCLQVESEEELLQIAQQAKEAMLEVHVITDAGLTEFNGVPTKTCLAIGPDRSDKIDRVTGHLKLY